MSLPSSQPETAAVEPVAESTLPDREGPGDQDPRADRSAQPARPGLGSWVRVAILAAILLSSAGLRMWQASRFEEDLLDGRQSPFALKEIPLNLGQWEGVNGQLDIRTADTAGATDNISRIYVNQLTGVRLHCLVLYGPAVDMQYHAPDRCYPASGYKQEGLDRVEGIGVGQEDRTVPFKVKLYARSTGGRIERHEVFWSWRYNDSWQFNLRVPRRMERVPGMFKVHVDRIVDPQEILNSESNPSKQFLDLLMPQIERLVERAVEDLQESESENPATTARADRPEQAGSRQASITR